MRVSDLRFFVGASLYHREPVCRLSLVPQSRAERLDGAVSSGLIGRATALFPRLDEVLAGVRVVDMGHFLLGLIEVLFDRVGQRLAFKNVLVSPDGSRSLLLFSYEDRHMAAGTTKFALSLLQRLLDAGDGSGALKHALEDELRQFAQRAAAHVWSVDTRYLVARARDLDIPAQVTERDFVIFGHGRYQRAMLRKSTPFTSFAATSITSNKHWTNRELARVGLPVPAQRVVSESQAVIRAAKSLGFPLVVKPVSTDWGVGVFVGVSDERSLVTAYERARKFANAVVLEAFLEGEEHRLLVIGDRMVAAAHRVPPHVIGDGHHSISRLVDILNRDPRRGIGKMATNNRIVVDDETGRVLADGGYALDDVPAAGERVFLRGSSNLSVGGTSIDVTDRVHPDNAAAAVLAARVVGLDVAGVDFITTDIGRSWKEIGGGICEVNINPGLRGHFSPGEGQPRDVGGPLFDWLFPTGAAIRVPIAAITGSNGKTTTTRISAHILRQNGARVGLTCTDGVYVDDELIRTGDLSGGPAAQQLLIDPRIDTAVLEIARGAILKYGTGIDHCEVAAVTNIAEEHLGELGVNSREDLARVKRLLVDLARRMVVLGADDPLTAGLAARSRAEAVCYVTTQAHNDLVEAHIASGHPAVRLVTTTDGPSIRLYDQGSTVLDIAAAAVPVTLGGRAVHNIQNAMFAIGVAYGLGCGPDTIEKALKSFRTDHDTNPGRLNVVSGLPFDLILDYCHNSHGLAAIGPMVDSFGAQRRVLAYSMPGNRRKADFDRAMQVAARHFDEFHLYPVADYYLRGRQPKEITTLLAQGLAAAGVAGARIHEHGSEEGAIDTLLQGGRPGDLAFLATLKTEKAWRQIQRFMTTREARQP